VRGISRRIRPALWTAVALGIAAAMTPLVLPHGNAAGQHAATRQTPAGSVIPAVGSGTGASAGPAVSLSPAALQRARDEAGRATGVRMPGARYSGGDVQVASLDVRATGRTVGKLQHLKQADLLVIGPSTLPGKAIRAISKLRGVASVEPVDAARIEVNGQYVAMLGVRPGSFRKYAAGPTAKSNALWQAVADGDIAVSYDMGKQDNLPLGGSVQVSGTKSAKLTVGGYGTVGIAGVDAVVSDQVARSLGVPADNALVISAPHAELSLLMRRIKKDLPRSASVTALVAQQGRAGLATSLGSAGAYGVTGGQGLTAAQDRAFLEAALSRVGMPYVWGAAGPHAFECSGLVQWSMRQAGIVMPRVAADQARTGPRIPLSELEPGDLLFYHTDPTAPDYISHVAIYLGDGLMVQAPEPGMDVQVVHVVFGAGFAGAVMVEPRLAAKVAADSPE
jgi:peptidoglycan DL-endopeptidase CwlO